MGKIAGRPLLQDLVKAAMVDSAARVRVTDEARLQQEKTASAEEKCAKCGKEKCACAGKTAAAAQSPDDAHVTKLASALDFLSGEFRKGGSSMAGPYGLTEHLQTSPPGVSQATSSKPLPDHKGQGVHIVPMHPGQQKAMKTEHGGTQMENTQDHAPELHKEMPPNIVNGGGKHAGASVVSLIRQKLASPAQEHAETEGMAAAKAGLEKAEKAHESEPENKGKKEGSAPTDLVSYMLSKTKHAEDAINPAQISAGAAVPPETSEAGQSGGQPAGGAPQGPTGITSSAESAINATKGQAYAPRKAELGKFFNEPALSAAHDSVLQAAFDNTGKAGPKIAAAATASEGDGKTASAGQTVAATSVKTAAARVLLSSLAKNIEAQASA
jgi:hypothetical protein